MKEGIIDSILDDMPKPINYREQIQEIVWSDSLSQLPIELQNAISLNKDIKNYLYIKSTLVEYCGNMYLSSFNYYIQSKTTIDKMKELHLLNNKQDEKRKEIRNNLEAIIYGCATSNIIADNYPEFAGYLPKEEKPIRNLSSVDLINQLKQLGWNQKQKV